MSKLLKQTADQCQNGEKIVLVVDALDEAGTPPNQNVLGLPKVLPDLADAANTLAKFAAVLPKSVVTLAKFSRALPKVATDLTGFSADLTKPATDLARIMGLPTWESGCMSPVFAPLKEPKPLPS